MKKGYFIAYLGATATMGIVLSQAGRMAKKYGQPLTVCQKPSLESIIKAGESGIDFFLKKKSV